MSFDAATGQEDTQAQEGCMRRLILQTGVSIDGYVAALDKSHPGVSSDRTRGISAESLTRCGPRVPT
jgi:hypothetical protein